MRCATTFKVRTRICIVDLQLNVLTTAPWMGGKEGEGDGGYLNRNLFSHRCFTDERDKGDIRRKRKEEMEEQN